MSAAATVHTHDVDEARHEVGTLFCPHRLSPTGPEPLHLVLRSRRFGGVGLVQLDYGAPVLIEPGDLETFHLVQLPMAGTAHVRSGRDAVVSSPELASVLSPGAEVSMEWGARNPQTIFYVDRATLDRHLEALLGRPPGAPLRFDLGMRMADPAVRAWHRSLSHVQDEIDHDSPFLGDPAFGRQVEEVLVGRLLAAHPHTHSEWFDRVAPPASGVIARAADLIRDHHGETLTVADIAEAVGLGIRALQLGFARDLATTPSAYLRRARLDAARLALLAGDTGSDSVTTIATAHGFTHLGRFSVEYRRAYGESPRDTLHAGRRSVARSIVDRRVRR